jgi:hypothetical protein
MALPTFWTQRQTFIRLKATPKRPSIFSDTRNVARTLVNANIFSVTELMD